MIIRNLFYITPLIAIIAYGQPSGNDPQFIINSYQLSAIDLTNLATLKDRECIAYFDDFKNLPILIRATQDSLKEYSNTLSSRFASRPVAESLTKSISAYFSNKISSANSGSAVCENITLLVEFIKNITNELSVAPSDKINSKTRNGWRVLHYGGVNHVIVPHESEINDLKEILSAYSNFKKHIELIYSKQIDIEKMFRSGDYQNSYLESMQLQNENNKMTSYFNEKTKNRFEFLTEYYNLNQIYTAFENSHDENEGISYLKQYQTSCCNSLFNTMPLISNNVDNITHQIESMMMEADKYQFNFKANKINKEIGISQDIKYFQNTRNMLQTQITILNDEKKRIENFAPLYNNRDFFNNNPLFGDNAKSAFQGFLYKFDLFESIYNETTNYLNIVNIKIEEIEQAKREAEDKLEAEKREKKEKYEELVTQTYLNVLEIASNLSSYNKTTIPLYKKQALEIRSSILSNTKKHPEFKNSAFWITVTKKIDNYVLRIPEASGRFVKQILFNLKTDALNGIK